MCPQPVPFERALPRQHLEQHAAERPDSDRLLTAVSPGLFRTHVGCGAITVPSRVTAGLAKSATEWLDMTGDEPRVPWRGRSRALWPCRPAGP